MSLWRNGDFLKLWTGQTVSILGSTFTNLAIQFAAAVVLQATPSEMGLLAAVNSAPLLLSLFAGVWVDRHRRRTTMIAVDITRALLLATIPAAALLGALSLPQLYAVGLLTKALGVVFDVAYTSYLPTLVELDRALARPRAEDDCRHLSRRRSIEPRDASDGRAVQRPISA